MEKEKRKQQPRKNMRLYVALMFLVGVVCLGYYLLNVFSYRCTWNFWDIPSIAVPESSNLISETNSRNANYTPSTEQYVDDQLTVSIEQYVDDQLTMEALYSFFDVESWCSGYTGYYTSCFGTIDFHGTNADYFIKIYPTDRTQQTTTYSIEFHWMQCPAT